MNSLFQVASAEKRGAIGVILFTDPADAVRGSATYPDSMYAPDGAVQMGTTRSGNGEPLTSFYPSIGRFIICTLFRNRTYPVDNTRFRVIVLVK